MRPKKTGKKTSLFLVHNLFQNNNKNVTYNYILCCKQHHYESGNFITINAYKKLCKSPFQFSSQNLSNLADKVLLPNCCTSLLVSVHQHKNVALSFEWKGRVTYFMRGKIETPHGD